MQIGEAKLENRAAFTVAETNPGRFTLVSTDTRSPLLNKMGQEFKIPEVGELPRIDRSSPRPAREVLRNSAYILKFKEHAPGGDGYIILTDHSEEDYLKSLEKLANHREAALIRCLRVQVHPVTAVPAPEEWLEPMIRWTTGRLLVRSPSVPLRFQFRSGRGAHQRLRYPQRVAISVTD